MTTATTAPYERPRGRADVRLPQRWNWLFHGFRKYAVRYVARHFHALRLSNASAPLPPSDAPVLVVLNHPAWWDPLVCFVLSREFGDAREHYAAIDAVAVRKYQFFTRLGFFGVDQESVRGAAEFLRTGQSILSAPNRV